ncbi:nuclear pore membrane glycoprotein 210-like [Adelges cooleyi]|uniref:nuclear pore membrane glycoprotein 210-like n=1 Tax=Adelges cooleyi TaxID=133065 RepID=UPI00217FC2B7|nr:nuclear pore membrane glycoprotein 210-like [Adelges cooleyi]
MSFKVLHCAILLGILCGALGSKLNVPRVLLPVLDRFTVNFIVEVTDGGCYKWSLFKGDNIVKLLPLDLNPNLGCSSRVSVSPLSNDKVRKTAIIFAEDISSGDVIHCHVIVDTIASLQIVTKTRELFVGDAPELFEVSAFDDQGNRFTTLDGVEFQWSINVLRDPTNTVLQFISFKNSPYSTPPDLYELDEKNKQGHMVLVEGVKTGSAIVSVKLASADKPISQVELSVIANLRLNPAHVNILPGDLLQIDIYQIQNEKMVQIKLPSKQFSVEFDTMTDSLDVLIAENDSGLFRGLKPGQVRLNLNDNHIEAKNDTLPKAISSFVNVCKAKYLSIVIKPHNRQTLIIDNVYELEVYLFNSNNQSIQIGPNVDIAVNLPDEYFKVLQTTRNGSFVVVQPIKLGIPKVKASLIEPYEDAATNVIISVPIYSRVKVKPADVVFPWHLNLNSGLQYALEATGGDKKYSWTTNDATISTVSSVGVVTSQGLGENNVSATMTRDVTNRGFANVKVVMPDELKIIAQPVEQEAGKLIVLYMQLIVKNAGFNEETSATVCNHNQFKIDIDDFQFTVKPYKSNLLVSDSCAAFSISSDVVSSTRVTVSFETAINILKASVIVSTFKKLVPLRPESKRTVLAPGCSTTLLFYGGPQPWLGHSTDYKVEFNIDNDLIKFGELPVNRDVDGHKTYAYSVTCKSLGSSKANLTVRSISDTHKSNITEVVSKTSVEIICASPKFIKALATDIEDSCPLTKSSHKIVSLNFEKLRVRINIVDENGNIFDNATMLNASWSVTDASLVRVVDILNLNEIKEYGFSFPDYHFAILEPLNKIGSTDVAVQLTGYKKPFTVPNDSRFSSFLGSDTKVSAISPPIKHSLTILLVNNVVVKPEKVSVVYHPKITSKLYVDQGSGYFNVHMTSQDIAKVTHSGRQIEVTPLAPGSLALNIVDLCLKSKQAEVTFEVRSIYRIELLTNAFVEVGESIRALIKVYDSEDNLLAFQANVLKIQSFTESNILTVTKQKDEPQRKDFDNEIVFNIKGLELGETNIYFVADTYHSKQIRTQTSSIRVYSPLQITPRNLTLAVGSSYQLTVHGGPQLECVFEYTSDDDNIVKVINGGLVKGLKVGTITVTGMAVGVDVISGKKVVYSKDIITVKVVKLTNVKIEVPLLKIKSGEIMPAWVRGVPDALSPIIIGTIKPSLLYQWSTSSAGVIHISDVLENTGILVREEDRLSVRIRAIRAGNTRVSVTVSDPSSKVVFTNFIDVTVYDELRLISHSLPLNSLIVAPNTEFTLTTNKYKTAKQSYWVVGSSKFEKNNLIEQDKSYNTPTISIDDTTGTIRTSNSLGRANIFITSTEDFNIVQSLDVPIEVKRVHYIMLNLETTISSKEPSEMSMIPSGMNMKLVVTYHDDKGTPFKEINSNIRYSTNHQNQISMTPGNLKNSMQVSLFESGEVILKIWDDGVQHFKEDYIKFNVEHLIYPNQATVTVGDVICFLMPVKFNEEGLGEWQSDNVKSLTVENLSGFSVAMAPSDVFVTYSNKKFTTSTSVNILPIKEIIILPADKSVLSNSGPIDIPLILLNELESPTSIKSKKGNLWEWRDDDCSKRNNIVKRYPFVCHVRFEPISSGQVEIPLINRIFDINPKFNTRTGFYSCQLTPLPITDPEMSLFKAKIAVQVSAGNIHTDFKEFKFSPSVFINKKELFFGQLSGNDKLILIGLPQILSQIEVTSSNTSLVRPVLSNESENEKVYVFEVNEYFWNSTFPDLHIVVFSRLTDQHSKIAIVTSRSLFNYDFSRTNANTQHSANKVHRPSMFYFLPAQFSSSVFFNPYIIALAVAIVTSCFIYCYGLPMWNNSMFFIKNPPNPPSPSVVGFYNRSYSSDQSNRSPSLSLNRSLTRRQ